MTLLRSISRLCLPALAVAVAGCTTGPRRALSVHYPADLREGEQARLTVTVTNVFPEAIIPVSFTVYARPSPAEYFTVRHIVADVNCLQPLYAAEVRHLPTLNRIEADHIRDGAQWRRIPHSRFLHPHILLPGQTYSQDFEFQAYASYRRLLYVDFFYLRVLNERIASDLYVTSDPVLPPPEAERFTQVFHRVTPDQLSRLEAEPRRYLLHRPHLPNVHPPQLISKAVELPVASRAFSYADAARRARYGARTHCFFSAGCAWVFDYDTGTWFITPTETVKLAGHYIDLVAELERGGVTNLALAAPRVAGDKLLDYFQKAGYSDPQVVTPTAQAVIPTKDLITVLDQAEQLGYLVDRTTWRAAPAVP